MNYIDKYRKYLKILSLLTRDAFELNIYLSSSITNKTDEIFNKAFLFLSIFSKIALHADSILTILPKDDPRNLYGTESFRFVDLSSVASLTRDIIDADNTLFYLFTEKIASSEREFRFLLFALHGYIRWREIGNLVNSSHQEEMVATMTEEIDSLIGKLEGNSFFRTLEKEMAENTSRGKRAKDIFKRVEGKIVNVKDAVFLTRKQIAEVRGMDLSSFDAAYIFFSSHVHSFLMGTSLVGSAIVLSEKSLMLLLLTLRNASFYLCLAMIDATILFQGAEEKVSPESRKILQSIMKGESYVL
jgi:hypothetical protein